jgi:hypothetical protein
MKACVALLAALLIVACGSGTSPDGGNPTPDGGNPTPDGGAPDGGGGTHYTIGGLIQTAGASGLVLATPGEPNLTIPASYTPPFAFANAVASGTAYDVTVFAQPTTSDCGGALCVCTVTDGGVGVVGNANVTSVLVSCVIELP